MDTQTHAHTTHTRARARTIPLITPTTPFHNNNQNNTSNNNNNHPTTPETGNVRKAPNKWVFATTLGRIAEALVDFHANADEERKANVQVDGVG